jgi:transcription antitermination factor NusG
MWYAFRVTPQKEFATVDVLRRRGVNATVPFEVKFLRRHGSQKKKLEKAYPLLVGYVLADLPGPHSIYGVMNLSYLIKSVVGFNGMPAILNQCQVERMLAQSGQQIANRQSVNTRKSLAKGDMAFHASEAYQNHPVRVEELKGERAKIMVTLLGSEREVWTHISNLRAA